MNTPKISFLSTMIFSVGTFISRISGIIKLSIVNFLFGANSDAFYSANANILSLRKVLGEGPLVNSMLPIYSTEKNDPTSDAFKFASNIINQLIIISLTVTILGILFTPMWTRTFLPGFNDSPEIFRNIVQLTAIMLVSTLFFSCFSLVMGVLNSHQRFVSSSFSPVLSNIIFILFPLFTHKQLGIMSLGWAVVFGSLSQLLMELIELKQIGFRYHFYINFNDSNSKHFWRLFFPTAMNYLAQSGISIGLGYFASFLPKGSMTYLRNANTIMIAPVGFIGVAISSVIFPLFSQVKDHSEKLAELWSQGLLFLLFASIPFSLFFTIYPDIIINMIFRDLPLFVSGSTGLYTQELLDLTIHAIRILGTILIPWSLNIMIGKLFYALEKPNIPFFIIVINFVTNILGYSLARHFNWGGDGLMYSDLVSAWITWFISVIILHKNLPKTNTHSFKIIKFIIYFTILSGLIWIACKPLHYLYMTSTHPFVHLVIGGFILAIGLLSFFGISHVLKINPMTDKNLATT